MTMPNLRLPLALLALCLAPGESQAPPCSPSGERGFDAARFLFLVLLGYL
jgi:hypothetical protein